MRGPKDGSPLPPGDSAAAHRRDDTASAEPARQLSGWTASIATALAAGLSLYALYWVIGIIQPQIYRPTFLLLALVLTFLLYPAHPRWRPRITMLDWSLVALAVVALGWPLVDLDQFVYRAATPSRPDLVLGVITTVLVLEATRRTVGSLLPITALGFLAYAYYGPFLELVGLDVFAHRGYDTSRLVGTLYMTLEGIFGVPLGVAATYIVLFTIFGAVLSHSGAGQFFINWTMSAFGRSASGAGPGRTVTLSGFLLGTVSGSGVATTVTLGAIAWPLLRRAGFSAEMGGAILSASGIGAIMAPPTMGAAAFLIAEYLSISYLQVIGMAVIPAVLYYVSIILMIEADARRTGTMGLTLTFHRSGCSHAAPDTSFSHCSPSCCCSSVASRRSELSSSPRLSRSVSASSVPTRRFGLHDSSPPSKREGRVCSRLRPPPPPQESSSVSSRSQAWD